MGLTHLTENDKAAANGVATLNSNGFVPNSQIRGGGLKQAVFNMPLRGVTDSTVNLVGERRTVTSGETGDYVTDFAVSNNHVNILVNTITTGGGIIITGDSVDESTGLVTLGDTEVITVDTTAAQCYQSIKKWWSVTNIDITTGTIVSIDYDVLVVGYTDFGNTDFKIVGYRIDAFAQGSSGDFAFVLTKVNDDGAGKASFIELENIGIDSGNAGDQIIDNLRTGGNDRSYDPPVSQLWGDDTTIVFKITDFDTYFSADENHIEAATKNEGFIIRMEGSPSGGITNVDWITIRIDYEFI